MYKIFFLGLSVFFSAGLLHAGEPIVGEASLVKTGYGSQLVIKGNVANELFTLLKNATENGNLTVKDGVGMNCYKESTQEVYCIIPVSSLGVLDLYKLAQTPQ